MNYKKLDPTRIKGNGDILIEGDKVGVLVIRNKKKYVFFGYIGLTPKELRTVAKMMEGRK